MNDHIGDTNKMSRELPITPYESAGANSPQREINELRKRLAAAEAERDESRDEAQYFYRDAIAHGALESDAQWLQQHPWLEDE